MDHLIIMYSPICPKTCRVFCVLVSFAQTSDCESLRNYTRKRRMFILHEIKCNQKYDIEMRICLFFWIFRYPDA